MYLPKEEGSNFEPTPAGTHPAICYRFIDMGTQQSTYMGTPRSRHEILLSWEITDPDLLMKDGRPFTVHKRYTWSMSEKANLRKDLEAWRGKAFEEKDFGEGGFDIRNVIGKPCLLSIVNVTKDGNIYSNLNGIMALPKGMTAAMLVNETVFIALNAAEFDREQFGKLSENLQGKIKAAPEYQAIINPQPVEQIESENPAVGIELNDEIPF